LDTPEKRLNVRSTEAELSAWREVAARDHLDLSTWLRRLAWREVRRARKHTSPKVE
jgi:hypothetical protein